ncbi:ABC transporter permease [Microtetraspora sp. NBRC 16547]|uniref:ABC transporter permease n=1 Tax=Microtetraspora sp. NBRC 16547 TaxID=3030993 RepID=UPI0024A5AC75|nr:ABC transporter permease [Microtetraspora sp. NBRC 16547]GLX00068.1 ABC transporter permease [Microtetraspora sp. NBRC 16547]
MNGLLLVAGREIRTQVRSKAFVVGLVIMVLLVGAISFAPKVLGGPDSYKVGLVASERLPVWGDTKIEWKDYADEAGAQRAVLDGDVDAALVGGTRVLTDGAIDDQLGLLLQSAHREAQIGSSGVKITPLSMESVGADTRYQKTRSGIAVVLVIVLFMLIIGTPMMVAMGVVEEKGSRIVEILLTSVRPWQLLGGKILGLGAVGMINLVAILVAGLGGALASGLAVDFPPGMAGIVVGVCVWFVLGYVFFAALAAALGSLVSRQEEVGNVLTPMTMTMMASYGVAFYSVKEPTSLVATIVSYIPPFSSMVMPVRSAAAEVPLWQVLISAGLMVAGVVVVVLLAARIYERAVLRTGARVRLRDVVTSR